MDYGLMYNYMALAKVTDIKFVFIHIYKCGGMSLRTLIQNNMQTAEIGKAHSTANEAMVLCDKANQMNFWETSFKFTFVRNPYDWMVSLFEFIRNLHSHENHNEVKNMSFDDFCAWYCENVKTKKKNISGTFNTLTDFVCDNNGNLLVDYVGKLENYHTDIINVANEIKLTLNDNNKIILPHINKSNRATNYRSYYNQFSKKIITDTFQDDLNFFKYKY